MSLTVFQIKLHKENATFSPGEIISGDVIVELSRIKSFRGLKLEFKGNAKVEWTEHKHNHHHRANETSHQHRHGTTRMEHFSAREDYFHTEIYLCGSSDGTVELTPGLHIFPFTFPLPTNIPSSFDHEPGKIDYYIRAVIDRPWKFDHETKKDFFVISPIDLTQYRATPIDDVIEATYCNCLCPCISQGSMQAEIHFPTNAYISGDAIEVMINLKNNSQSINIQKMKIKLEQVMEFFAHMPHHKSKQSNSFLAEAKQYGPFRTNTSIKLGIQVPAINCLGLPHCSIINIKYRVNVIIIPSGCHCNSERNYDILLGTKTISSAVMSEPNSYQPSAPYDNASVPTAPPEKIEILLENNFMNPSVANTPYPPASGSDYSATSSCPYPSSIPPAIGFHVPNRDANSELLPPSYDDAIKQNKN